MILPPSLLRRFYVSASLRNVDDGIEFTLMNRVAPATVIALGPLEVDGVPFEGEQVTLTAAKPRSAAAVSDKRPFPLEMGREVRVRVRGVALAQGAHQVLMHVVTREIGAVVFTISDFIGMPGEMQAGGLPA